MDPPRAWQGHEHVMNSVPGSSFSVQMSSCTGASGMTPRRWQLSSSARALGQISQ